jgi:hypothetical protein
MRAMQLTSLISHRRWCRGNSFALYACTPLDAVDGLSTRQMFDGMIASMIVSIQNGRSNYTALSRTGVIY